MHSDFSLARPPTRKVWGRNRRLVLERLSDPQHIEYVLRRVEAEVAKLYTHVPESIHLKEVELTAEGRRLANFVDFIGEVAAAAHSLRRC